MVDTESIANFKNLTSLIEKRIERAVLKDGDSDLANLLRLSQQFIEAQKGILCGIATILAKDGYDLTLNVLENTELKVQALQAELKVNDLLQTQVDELTLKNRALLIALESDANPPGPQFLQWVADRLIHVYGEDPDIDFVHALRRKANKMQQAIDLCKKGDS